MNEDQAANEQGWLIEGEFDGTPTYWCVHDGRSMFTTDHLMAVRFARKEDADLIRAWIAPGEQIKSVQHGWAVQTATDE